MTVATWEDPLSPGQQRPPGAWSANWECANCKVRWCGECGDCWICGRTQQTWRHVWRIPFRPT